MEWYEINEEHEKITGWKTIAEAHAYDTGREHEQTVIMEWIEKWDGSINSGMGDLLRRKVKELYNI